MEFSFFDVELAKGSWPEQILDLQQQAIPENFTIRWKWKWAIEHFKSKNKELICLQTKYGTIIAMEMSETDIKITNETVSTPNCN